MQDIGHTAIILLPLSALLFSQVEEKKAILYLCLVESNEVIFCMERPTGEILFFGSWTIVVRPVEC